MTGMVWIIVGLAAGISCTVGFISGRIGVHIGVRGVRRRLGECEQELESLGARFTKLANARKSDLATEARVDGKQNELVKILSDALNAKTAGINQGAPTQPYPPGIM
jgi:hypothetical protein